MRVGAKGLSLLSMPLNVHVLKALEAGPLVSAELRRAVGSPPPTTLRLYVRDLMDMGVLVRRRGDGFSPRIDLELTDAGRDLSKVADLLQRWLGQSPEGPIALGSMAAKSAVKALVEAWSTNIVRALAMRPMALTELSRLISDLNYPSLERRLAAVKHAGLVESCEGNGRVTPYGPSQWLRRSMAPLTAAALWERTHFPDELPPIAKVDVEAVFLLAVPLLRLPPDLSGRCRLVAEVRRRDSLELAGIVAKVEEGEVVRCSAGLDGYTEAWIAGTPRAWMDRLLHNAAGGLEVGGACDLAEGLLRGLQQTQLEVG